MLSFATFSIFHVVVDHDGVRSGVIGIKYRPVTFWDEHGNMINCTAIWVPNCQVIDIIYGGTAFLDYRGVVSKYTDAGLDIFNCR